MQKFMDLKKSYASSTSSLELDLTVFREIKTIPINELETILAEIEKLPEKEKQAIEEISQSYCHDRKFCNSVDIDYCNIQGKDVNMIKILNYIKLISHIINI